MYSNPHICMDDFDPNHEYEISFGVHSKGCTKLMYMILKNICWTKMIKYVKSHKDEINKQNDIGWTPLMILCANGQENKNYLKLIELLLNMGADINIKNNCNCTASMLATLNPISAELILNILLKYKPNLNIISHAESTILIYTVCMGVKCTNIMQLLLDHGADPNIHGNRTNALLKAAFYSRTIGENIVSKLLEFGANPNSQPYLGVTALMIATLYCDTSSTENTMLILLKHGADPNLYDDNKQTCLFNAIYNKTNKINTTRILLEHNADPNWSDNTGTTPLLAAFTIDDNVIMEAVIKLLLKHGANPNKLARAQITPLTYVIRKKNSKDALTYVKLFMEYGADLNIADNSNSNALNDYIIYRHDSDELFKLLLDNTINVNCISSSHLCLFSNKHIKMLLDYGLRITDKNIPSLLSRKFGAYVQFYYYLQQCLIFIFKELLATRNKFMYRPTGIPTRINLLKMNLQTKNYRQLSELTDYCDIINYIGVVNIDHLIDKIKYYSE